MTRTLTRKEAGALIERTYAELNDLVENSGIRRTSLDSSKKTYLGYTDALLINFNTAEYKEAVASLDMASYAQYFGKFAELASLLNLGTAKSYKGTELLDPSHLAEAVEKTDSAQKLTELLSGFSSAELSQLSYRDKAGTADKMLAAWTMFPDRERQFMKLTDAFTPDELPAFIGMLTADKNKRLRQMFRKVNGKERTHLLSFFDTLLEQKGFGDSSGKSVKIPGGYTAAAQFEGDKVLLSWYRTDANGTVLEQKNAEVSPFALVSYQYKNETVEVPALTFLSDEGQEDFLFENKYGESLDLTKLTQAQRDALFWEFTVHYLPGSIRDQLFGNPLQYLATAIICVLASTAVPEIAVALAVSGSVLSVSEIVNGATFLKQALDVRYSARNAKELKTAAKIMADALSKIGINIINIILTVWQASSKEAVPPSFENETDRGTTAVVHPGEPAVYTFKLTQTGFKNKEVLEKQGKIKEFYLTFDNPDTATRILNTVDDPLKVLDAKYQENTLRLYARLSKRGINEIAKALKARNEAALSPEQMVVLLKANVNPPKTLARITIEYNGRYQTLTNKDLAWVMDPKEIMGLTNEQIMIKLGFEDNDIKTILAIPKEQRPRFKITLIEDPGNIRTPTWDVLMQDTIDLIDKGDEDFLSRMIKAIPELETKTGGIDKAKLAVVFTQLKETPVEDIPNLPSGLNDFRYILQYKFGNNELFSSRGATITKDGRFGLREWVLSEPELGFNFGMMKSSGFKIKNFDLSWE